MKRAHVVAVALSVALTATGAYAAPRATRCSRRVVRDVQAPRDKDEVQSPRGTDVQAPRDKDEVQSPRNQDEIQSPRSQDECKRRATRTKSSRRAARTRQSPRGQDTSAPRDKEEVQVAPRSEHVAAPVTLQPGERFTHARPARVADAPALTRTTRRYLVLLGPGLGEAPSERAVPLK